MPPARQPNPEQDEVETCEPFLFTDHVIKPKVIVALGKFGAQTLRTLDPISRLRGRVQYRGAKLVPTFHPACMLRNPSSKREVWEDMKLVRHLLQESRSLIAILNLRFSSPFPFQISIS